MSVTVLLATPLKFAVTLILVPAVALGEIVPAPLPFVNVRSVVSEFVQVTDVVMSCGVPLLGNCAIAVNVTGLLAAGVVVEAVRVIDVGVPSATVIVVVAGVTVPKLALTLVVQIPVTVLTGVSRPEALIVAHPGVAEFHTTFPVKSLVEPSL